MVSPVLFRENVDLKIVSEKFGQLILNFSKLSTIIALLPDKSISLPCKTFKPCF